MSNFKHGLRYHPLYDTWREMRKRCYSKTYKRYADWGGRGITVCDRWLGPDGCANFIQDMGPRPEGATLERVDNDGPYSPDNCVWADVLTQNRNRRPPTGNPYVEKLQAEVAALRAENERLRKLLAPPHASLNVTV